MKPRFTSEAQIEKAIDRCHEDSKRALFEAEALEGKAKALLQAAHDTYEQACQIDDTAKREATSHAAGVMKADGIKAKSEAGKLRLYATNKIEKRCKYLGEKLAEFQTGLLAGMPGDGSVQK